ncbi:diphosphomevalonate decarboxylase [Lactobacillus sp. YT155]|uniref:diphosphomevalonate decarboxylase n=1 Tax=Lactobacillus sp. YT155 TaxID=3060955 RepID=UPI00265E45EE|nr:diphosphomevalonate decarboxylase [Lactobacillus sp. YT155]MDO1605443.1 diphosphomevalonate decarboxylase [Lactobacillus sp. YT155]
MNQATAIAHTNIALIKYWGKANEELRLPYTDSLSLTLDEFFTQTTAIVNSEKEDIFILDNQLQTPEKSQRVFKFLDYFRKQYGINEHFKIESQNHVPNSAGLASSASAFAALSGALSKAVKLDTDLTELSRLARVGSGSASRSIFGGFVQWHAGTDNQSSYSEQLSTASESDISVVSVIINSDKKSISSTSGMILTKQTSPFYKLWPDIVKQDLTDIKQAIAVNDLSKIGEIAEHNAMEMHALTLSANPPFTYFEPATIKIINYVQELRKKGILAYYTIDAGPNVKIICSKKDAPLIKQKISDNLDEVIKVIITQPGPSITFK